MQTCMNAALTQNTWDSISIQEYIAICTQQVKCVMSKVNQIYQVTKNILASFKDLELFNMFTIDLQDKKQKTCEVLVYYL